MSQIDHVFGSGESFRLGVEEELILVDPESRELAHTSSELFEHLGELRAGEIKHDTYEALVELVTPICATATEALEHLQALRATLRETGAAMIGAGIHPGGRFGDVVHVPTARYREVLDLTRGLLKRTPTGAVHVHVGMPDPETAITVANRMRAYLPLLAALSANSPYWHGVDSGLASARFALWRGFRSAIVPREFADWEDFLRTEESAIAAGGLEDYSYLWWDIRPHARMGTVEIRAMDAQADLRAVHGLAALVQALATGCAHENLPGERPTTEAIGEGTFRGARDGTSATLLSHGEMLPVHELTARTLDAARAYSSDPDALEEVERLVREGNGADHMRAAFARGGMPQVLEMLAERTAGEGAPTRPAAARDPARRP